MSPENPAGEARRPRGGVDWQDKGIEAAKTARPNEKAVPPRRARVVRPFSYKIREAAVASGLSTGVLYAAIRQNRLPAFQPHPRAEMLVFRKHLIAFITRFPVNELASAAIAQVAGSEKSNAPDDSEAGEELAQ